LTQDKIETVRMEMVFSIREIFRLLPSALEGRAHRVKGSEIVVEEGDGTIQITLAEERTRRLGPFLETPVTDVSIRFDGISAAAAEAFLTRFRLHYQRGGG
jgi:hypothetical protein